MSDEPTREHAPWWRGTRGEYYVIVQFGIFALLAFGPRTLPGVSGWPEPLASLARWSGLVLMIAGVPLALTALTRLGPALTALPYPTDEARLVQSGPYAIVRHPIYAGLILGAIGWGLYLNSVLVLGYAALLFVLFDLKSRREEQWLVERFAEYPEYRTRVRKLIPWLY